jgi:hypothetical protein
MMYKVQSGIYNSTCSTIELIIRIVFFCETKRDIGILKVMHLNKVNIDYKCI